MKSAILVFPGSNCDRDAQTALHTLTGVAPVMVWHRETSLPERLDLIVAPGGFSHGDYLRAGAIAARAPIMTAVRAAAERGVTVLGICNGFQILCEVGLLPGALARNDRLSFVCRRQRLHVVNAHTRFTAAYAPDAKVVFPIAHHDGAYIADAETRKRLEDEGRIPFRYDSAADDDAPSGAQGVGGNPNGAVDDIAGVTNAAGNVLGLMPHPERAVDPAHGGVDGIGLFQSVMRAA